jgi:hypothetical protein
MKCAYCSAPVVKPSTGRPPKFCSTACKNAAAYSIKRVDRRCELLQQQIDALPSRQTATMGTHPYGHGTRTLAQQREHLTTLLRDAEMKLRDLVAEGGAS